MEKSKTSNNSSKFDKEIGTSSKNEPKIQPVMPPAADGSMNRVIKNMFVLDPSKLKHYGLDAKITDALAKQSDNLINSPVHRNIQIMQTIKPKSTGGGSRKKRSTSNRTKKRLEEKLEEKQTNDFDIRNIKKKISIKMNRESTPIANASVVTSSQNIITSPLPTNFNYINNTPSTPEFMSKAESMSCSTPLTNARLPNFSPHQETPKPKSYFVVHNDKPPGTQLKINQTNLDGSNKNILVKNVMVNPSPNPIKSNYTVIKVINRNGNAVLPDGNLKNNNINSIVINNNDFRGWSKRNDVTSTSNLQQHNQNIVKVGNILDPKTNIPENKVKIVANEQYLISHSISPKNLKQIYANNLVSDLDLMNLKQRLPNAVIKRIHKPQNIVVQNKSNALDNPSDIKPVYEPNLSNLFLRQFNIGNQSNSLNSTNECKTLHDSNLKILYVATPQNITNSLQNPVHSLNSTPLRKLPIINVGGKLCPSNKSIVLLQTQKEAVRTVEENMELLHKNTPPKPSQLNTTRKSPIIQHEPLLTNENAFSEIRNINPFANKLHILNSKITVETPSTSNFIKHEPLILNEKAFSEIRNINPFANKLHILNSKSTVETPSTSNFIKHEPLILNEKAFSEIRNINPFANKLHILNSKITVETPSTSNLPTEDINNIISTIPMPDDEQKQIMNIKHESVLFPKLETVDDDPNRAKTINPISSRSKQIKKNKMSQLEMENKKLKKILGALLKNVKEEEITNTLSDDDITFIEESFDNVKIKIEKCKSEPTHSVDLKPEPVYFKTEDVVLGNVKEEKQSAPIESVVGNTDIDIKPSVAPRTIRSKFTPNITKIRKVKPRDKGLDRNVELKSDWTKKLSTLEEIKRVNTELEAVTDHGSPFIPDIKEKEPICNSVFVSKSPHHDVSVTMDIDISLEEIQKERQLAFSDTCYDVQPYNRDDDVPIQKSENNDENICRFSDKILNENLNVTENHVDSNFGTTDYESEISATVPLSENIASSKNQDAALDVHTILPNTFASNETLLRRKVSSLSSNLSPTLVQDSSFMLNEESGYNLVIDESIEIPDIVNEVVIDSFHQESTVTENQEQSGVSISERNDPFSFNETPRELIHANVQLESATKVSQTSGKNDTIVTKYDSKNVVIDKLVQEILIVNPTKSKRKRLKSFSNKKNKNIDEPLTESNIADANVLHPPQAKASQSRRNSKNSIDSDITISEMKNHFSFKEASRDRIDPNENDSFIMKPESKEFDKDKSVQENLIINPARSKRKNSKSFSKKIINESLPESNIIDASVLDPPQPKSSKSRRKSKNSIDLAISMSETKDDFSFDETPRHPIVADFQVKSTEVLQTSGENKTCVTKPESKDIVNEISVQKNLIINPARSKRNNSKSFSKKIIDESLPESNIIDASVLDPPQPQASKSRRKSKNSIDLAISMSETKDNFSFDKTSKDPIEANFQLKCTKVLQTSGENETCVTKPESKDIVNEISVQENLIINQPRSKRKKSKSFSKKNIDESLPESNIIDTSILDSPQPNATKFRRNSKNSFDCGISMSETNDNFRFDETPRDPNEANFLLKSTNVLQTCVTKLESKDIVNVSVQESLIINSERSKRKKSKSFSKKNVDESLPESNIIDASVLQPKASKARRNSKNSIDCGISMSETKDNFSSDDTPRDPNETNLQLKSTKVLQTSGENKTCVTKLESKDIVNETPVQENLIINPVRSKRKTSKSFSKQNFDESLPESNIIDSSVLDPPQPKASKSRRKSKNYIDLAISMSETKVHASSDETPRHPIVADFQVKFTEALQTSGENEICLTKPESKDIVNKISVQTKNSKSFSKKIMDESLPEPNIIDASVLDPPQPKASKSRRKSKNSIDLAISMSETKDNFSFDETSRDPIEANFQLKCTKVLQTSGENETCVTKPESKDIVNEISFQENLIINSERSKRKKSKSFSKKNVDESLPESNIIDASVLDPPQPKASKSRRNSRNSIDCGISMSETKNIFSFDEISRDQKEAKLQIKSTEVIQTSGENEICATKPESKDIVDETSVQENVNPVRSKRKKSKSFSKKYVDESLSKSNIAGASVVDPLQPKPSKSRRNSKNSIDLAISMSETKDNFSFDETPRDPIEVNLQLKSTKVLQTAGENETCVTKPKSKDIVQENLIINPVRFKRKTSKSFSKQNIDELLLESNIIDASVLDPPQPKASKSRRNSKNSTDCGISMSETKDNFSFDDTPRDPNEANLQLKSTKVLQTSGKNETCVTKLESKDIVIEIPVQENLIINPVRSKSKTSKSFSKQNIDESLPESNIIDASVLDPPQPKASKSRRNSKNSIDCGISISETKVHASSDETLRDPIVADLELKSTEALQTFVENETCVTKPESKDIVNEISVQENRIINSVRSKRKKSKSFSKKNVDVSLLESNIIDASILDPPQPKASKSRKNSKNSIDFGISMSETKGNSSFDETPRDQNEMNFQLKSTNVSQTSGENDTCIAKPESKDIVNEISDQEILIEYPARSKRKKSNSSSKKNIDKSLTLSNIADENALVPPQPKTSQSKRNSKNSIDSIKLNSSKEKQIPTIESPINDESHTIRRSGRKICKSKKFLDYECDDYLFEVNSTSKTESNINIKTTETSLSVNTDALLLTKTLDELPLPKRRRRSKKDMSPLVQDKHGNQSEIIKKDETEKEKSSEIYSKSYFSANVPLKKRCTRKTSLGDSTLNEGRNNETTHRPTVQQTNETVNQPNITEQLKNDPKIADDLKLPEELQAENTENLVEMKPIEPYVANTESVIDVREPKTFVTVVPLHNLLSKTIEISDKCNNVEDFKDKAEVNLEFSINNNQNTNQTTLSEAKEKTNRITEIISIGPDQQNSDVISLLSILPLKEKSITEASITETEQEIVNQVSLPQLPTNEKCISNNLTLVDSQKNHDLEMPPANENETFEFLPSASCKNINEIQDSEHINGNEIVNKISSMEIPEEKIITDQAAVVPKIRIKSDRKLFMSKIKNVKFDEIKKNNQEVIPIANKSTSIDSPIETINSSDHSIQEVFDVGENQNIIQEKTEKINFRNIYEEKQKKTVESTNFLNNKETVKKRKKSRLLSNSSKLADSTDVIGELSNKSDSNTLKIDVIDDSYDNFFEANESNSINECSTESKHTQNTSAADSTPIDTRVKKKKRKSKSVDKSKVDVDNQEKLEKKSRKRKFNDSIGSSKNVKPTKLITDLNERKKFDYSDSDEEFCGVSEQNTLVSIKPGLGLKEISSSTHAEAKDEVQKKRKRVVVTNVFSKPDIAKINKFICGNCKEVIPKKRWNSHLIKHNGLAWVDGVEQPMDLLDFNFKVNWMINWMKLNQITIVSCSICGIVKRKSALGLLTHEAICGKTEEELNVTCEYCKMSVREITINYHYNKSCPELKRQRLEEELKEKIITDDDSKSVVDLSESGRVKRKSVKKALNKIKKCIGESSLEDHYVERKPKKVTGGSIVRVRKELAQSNITKCNFNTCDFETDNEKTMIQHLYSCSKKGNFGYFCKSCKFNTTSEKTMKNHVQETHTDEVKKTMMILESGSEASVDEYSSESYESEGVDEDEDENCYKNENQEPDESDYDDRDNVKKKVIIRKLGPSSSSKSDSYKETFSCHHLLKEYSLKIKETGRNIFYSPAMVWFKSFIKENFSTSPLYLSLQSGIKNYLDFNLSKDYIPLTKTSVQFMSKIPTKYYQNFNTIKDNDKINWKKLNLFEAETTHDSFVLYCGGPITVMEWAPFPKDYKDNQYLAVTCKNNFSEVNRITDDSAKCIIQIWNCGKISNDISKKFEIVPIFKYAFVFDHGPILSMKFCPSGGYIPDQRIGLLAISSMIGDVFLYSLPLNIDEKQNTKLLELEPSVRLSSGLNQISSINSKICKLSWTKEKGHSLLVAGFTSGWICIWDLNTESKLLKREIKNKLTIMPIKTFKPFTTVISVLDIYHIKNSKYLVAGCERFLKMFDLTSHSHPIAISTSLCKSFILCGGWSIHWPSYTIGMDEGLCLERNTISLWQPFDIGFKNMVYQTINSPVIDISLNDWINCYLGCTESGDIVGYCAKDLYANVVRKENKRQKLMYGFTDTISLDKSKVDLNQSGETKAISGEEKGSYTYTEDYGLVFCDFSIPIQAGIRELNVKSHRRASLQNYPISKMTQIKYNPNFNSCKYYAIGYQAGFVRLRFVRPSML